LGGSRPTVAALPPLCRSQHVGFRHRHARTENPPTSRAISNRSPSVARLGTVANKGPERCCYRPRWRSGHGGKGVKPESLGT
jgi:hypothetical protein